jgi:uncharacterized protein (TIGR02145 family)
MTAVDGSSAVLNDYGFSVVPGGYGNSDGSFTSVDDYSGWWSANEVYNGYAYYRRMSLVSAYWYDLDKSPLFSVRCVQD